MQIRQANQSDYPELRNIFLSSRQQYFYWADQDSMTLEDFDKQTADEYIILAEDGHRVLGFASLYLPDDFIHLLFVHPEVSGQGVGKELLSASIEKMNRPARLKCVSENHKALKFYEKNGWKKVVEEEKDGEKYWVMEYQ